MRVDVALSHRRDDGHALQEFNYVSRVFDHLLPELVGVRGRRGSQDMFRTASSPILHKLLEVLALRDDRRTPFITATTSTLLRTAICAFV